MAACLRCGHDNPEGAAFCNACGTPLERQRVEVRKPATLIFCDVTGSTELADRIDAETVREVLFSCFHEVRAAIERHGGTVEKFIGDAVVGVFGVPVAHEDDPLRAARAALEVRAALPALNDDLERRFGARLAVRTGINTGEVVAGDPSTRASFVSGDAVNVAARLEQAAAPGQILLGETTYALVRDAVEALPLAPLMLKGKPEPVPCFELVRLHEERRPVRAPLLGRAAELAVLAGALADATASGEPRRLLVVGEAGVGKSRLVEEFLAHAEARALTARCLPYGEGITYSPLVQLVRQAAAIGDGSGREEARARLAGMLAPLDDDAETATAILAQVTGLAEGVASAAEIAWAARRFVEALAAEGPLVVLVDDLQWAEHPLVELLDSIADRARGRVLVLCLARPELERRADAPPADVHLDALDTAAAAMLLERLLGRREVDAEERAALLAAAGGNPLFLEELVTFLESHHAASAIPPTLDALLSAHVDMLDATERPVLERGSIEGEVFHHDGVVALGEGEPAAAVEETLLHLRAQDLVRATQATLGGGLASRFRHLLVRDVVYRSASKRRRAQLHLRFAGWLEERLGDRAAEVAEIVAYHLEQAWRLRSELGPLDEATVEVGERAAQLLGRSARRALARGDGRSALSLFTRAAELAAEDATRLDLALERGIAAREAGEFALASSILEEVSGAAAEQDAPDVAARSAIERALIRHHTQAGAVEGVRRAAEAGLATFRELGDEHGQAVALAALAEERWIALRCAEMEELLEQALVHAELAHSERLIASVIVPLARAILFGPRPSSAAIERCEELLARARRIGPTVEAGISMMLAVLEAAQGRGERSAQLSRRSKAILEELAPGPRVASAGQYAGLAALILGDPVAAERELRASYDLLAGLGERAVASTVAALLARALVDLGRAHEAEELCALSLEWADTSDLATHAYARSAWACALVARGSHADAVRHAHDAVRLSAASDFTNQRGDAFYDLALVLEAAGDLAGAAAAAAEAAALFGAKENVVSAARARALAARLGGAPMGRIPAPADPSKEDAMSELDPDRPEPGVEAEDDDAAGKFGPEADDDAEDKFGPDADDDEETEEQFGTEGDEE